MGKLIIRLESVSKEGESPVPDNIVKKLIETLEGCDMEATHTNWEYKKYQEGHEFGKL